MTDPDLDALPTAQAEDDGPSETDPATLVGEPVEDDDLDNEEEATDGDASA